jgi:hypothetical protein
MNPGRWFLAAGAIATAAAALWPTPGVAPGDSLSVRLACAALAAVALAAIHLTRAGRKRVWLAAALAAAAAGSVTLVLQARTLRSCVVDYVGTPRIIGRDLTSLGTQYRRDEPDLDNETLLLDAGGDAAAMWTAGSIESCRAAVTWSALLPIPLFAVAAGALIATARRRFAIAALRPEAAPATSPSGPSSPGYAYDAFMSYRHTEPDRSHAFEIVAALEAEGYRVAIDHRDFSPNEHFLAEIERCIRTSRFVLCVVTSRYLDSDHTAEEAVVSKTLDLSERRKRLVPLLFERVDLPVWLYGLSGIDCTPQAAVDPIDRLLTLIKSGREIRRA